MDLDDLLAGLDTMVRDELATAPEVVDWDGTLDVATLPIKVRQWIKVEEVVAVVADLRGSTNLGTGKRADSTARIYQAATGGLVEVLADFGANFLQIQGDGAFGLFWGDDRFERAVCAGVTIKTFSERHLVARLERKWPNAPETGFKVGIAASRVLVKRIGTPRNPAQQEPVWAGKAVNYAAKAAQQASRHEMIVTGTVWDHIAGNDFLALSCPCKEGPTGSLWSDVTIVKVPAGDGEREGRLLKAPWCEVHGEDYCAAVLAGSSYRPEAKAARADMERAQLSSSLQAVAARQRAEKTARLRGLSW